MNKYCDITIPSATQVANKLLKSTKSKNHEDVQKLI